MNGLVEEGTKISCKTCSFGKTCNVANSHEYKVEICSQYKPVKKMTNADKIRSLSDNELAEIISVNVDCGKCMDYLSPNDCASKLCKSAWLDWLKREVDE